MSVAARWLRLWPQGSQPNAPAGSVAIVDLPTDQGFSCLLRPFQGHATRSVQLRVKLQGSMRHDTAFTFEFQRETYDGSVIFRPSEPVQVELGSVEKVRMEVWDVALRDPIAYAEIETQLLETKQTWSLLLQDPKTSEAIYGTADRGAADQDDRTYRPVNRRPSFLRLFIQVDEPLSEMPCTAASSSSSPSVSRTEVRESSIYRPKVMLITRGTRGDVQPFVALARGLIKYHNCDVFIVTELAWRKFCVDNLKDLKTVEGQRRWWFRPCGGDTAQRVNTDLSQTFLSYGQHSVAIQALVYSRSEVEFFDSEGCFYHWAWKEKPDFIVFGFLLTHVAMIISEALQIPIVGFIFQPQREIEPFLSSSALEELMGPLREVLAGPRFIATLQQVMERMPDKYTLRDLRMSRGLAPARGNISASNQQEEELRYQGIPRIVPVSPVALGETQEKGLEAKGMTLTDFIFLRKDGGPKPSEREKEKKVLNFIEQAKREKRKVLLMTFSSMPVGLQRILRIAIIICRHCRVQEVRPVVIAMVKGQPEEVGRNAAHEEELQQIAKDRQNLERKKRLLVMHEPLDFGAFFPKVDAIILHGGLGVTSEALLAGKPAITSGILLMDQRYWAARLFELGCGSQGISVDDLLSGDDEDRCERVKKLVFQALSEEGDRSWAKRAREVQSSIQDYRGTYVVTHLVNQEAWRRYHQSLDVKPEDLKDYFVRDREKQVIGLDVLRDFNQLLPDQFPAQVLKQQEKHEEDPDGIRRNAEVIFAAGMQRKIVRDGYGRNRTYCRSCCRQTGCLLQCIKETIRFLLCLQVPACLLFWMRVFRACICCKPLKWMILWFVPRRTASATAGPMESVDSFQVPVDV